MISLKLLRAFWERHADAQRPLRQWYRTASHAEWASLADVRNDYPHADGVVTGAGDRSTVFNIGGNKYRLIVRIRYDYRLVNIRAVMTHREYDRGDWKE